MNKKSSTILTIAAGTFFVTVSVFGYVFFEISKQGKKIEESKKVISEHLAKEASFNKVESLLNSTEEERRAVSKFFIEEKDVISFVSEVEGKATKLGVELNTNNLSIQPEVKKDNVQVTPGMLVVGFDFSGSESAVRNFLLLLENIPYDKKIPTLTLAKQSENSWKATVTLNITMKYD